MRNKLIYFILIQLISFELIAAIKHPIVYINHFFDGSYQKESSIQISLLKFSINDTPALIPIPKTVSWKKNRFYINQITQINFNNPSIKKEALLVQSILLEKGFKIPLNDHSNKSQFKIELIIDSNNQQLTGEEAYWLTVSEAGVQIKSTNAHGVFNAIQTLNQLIKNNTIQSCDILDYPSFSWRGFMVDVGRNFQSIKQLKEQIDVMAAYKLNIFHFHLTEDIAWRLESKLYPALTSEKNMQRNAGKFYSIEELKSLIQYCNDRYITLVPEIDMPGHSAAFKRAMGVDMQSEQGTAICKNILTELCQNFNVPYVHIGGDEVKITNKSFLPSMIALLKLLGKKVVAWNPGGNTPEGTFLQMWNGNIVPKAKYPSIDSRHLYLNHFDPIDGVVATFNHMICDVPKGDSFKIGATLCNWPDRNVSSETDLINMNAVYPVMLTFAEKCWKGGGSKNYITDISMPDSFRYQSFVDFENRLLNHKANYFNNKPFPYVRQANIEWKLIGPYYNAGKTETAFNPELPTFLDTLQLNKLPSVYGGTIWLRHFWHPLIQSHLKHPKDSSTYYAIRKIWSANEENRNFWIGFNDFSRSTATDSPPIGAWDTKNSKLWVNGAIVAPPIWKSGGKAGDLEMPLTDEGYAYRSATVIHLKKGWNTILVKAPVGSFVPKDWKNQVKWMFTVLPL